MFFPTKRQGKECVQSCAAYRSSRRRSALIDIDVAYERDCKSVSQSSLDALAKAQSLKRLREQHQQRRYPLVQQLAALQEQA